MSRVGGAALTRNPHGRAGDLEFRGYCLLTRRHHFGMHCGWRLLLESEGFAVKAVETASMSLLEPGRLINDEGVMGAIRFALNVVRDGEARRRVFEMRRTFRRNRKLLAAVALLAFKQ